MTLKMRKTGMLLLVLMLVGSLSAQKIKIDKKTGIVTIDKVESAKLTTQKNELNEVIYTFTDLKSSDWVSLEMTKLSKDVEYFLQVTSSLSDKTSEMEYELLSMTLSMNTAISNLIIKKHGFFTTEGMQKEAIINFLNLEKRDFSLAHQEKAEEKQEIESKIEDFNIFKKDDLTIINKETNDVIIKLEDPSNQYNKYNNPSTDYADFIIKDHKGNKIGVVILKKGGFELYDYSITTYDGENFPLKRATPSVVPVETTKTLITNGYLGQGPKSIAHLQQLKAEALEEQKKDDEKAEMRTRVNGVLTLTNGEVLEGKFRLEFREVVEGSYKQVGNIANLDGKTITYYYKDDKGKTKGKVYKQKEIQSFEVIKEDEPDYQEVYTKIEYSLRPSKSSIVSGDAVDVINLGKSILGGGKSKKHQSLAYLAADLKKTALYFSGDEIYIQNKEAGKDIVELGISTLKEQLITIASNCPTVKANIDNNKYTFDRESMLQFVHEYDTCK